MIRYFCISIISLGTPYIKDLVFPLSLSETKWNGRILTKYLVRTILCTNLSEAQFLPKNCATSTDLFSDLNFGSKWGSLRFDTRNCLYQDLWGYVSANLNKNFGQFSTHFFTNLFIFWILILRIHRMFSDNWKRNNK